MGTSAGAGTAARGRAELRRPRRPGVAVIVSAGVSALLLQAAPHGQRSRPWPGGAIAFAAASGGPAVHNPGVRSFAAPALAAAVGSCDSFVDVTGGDVVRPAGLLS